MTNTKSGKYHFFFISPVICRPLTNGFLCMMELVLCLIMQGFCDFLNLNLLMIGFKSVYGIFVLDISAWSAFFAALSALSFPCIAMRLGIQVRMILLFLEKVLILLRSHMMKGVDVFLFCRAWRTDLESEWRMNLEDLWLVIMFMAWSIAVTSAL